MMYVNFKPSKAGDFDKVELKADDAKRIFHAINRVSSLVDVLTNGIICNDPSDTRALEVLNDFASSLERVLKPGQERVT